MTSSRRIESSHQDLGEYLYTFHPGLPQDTAGEAGCEDAPPTGWIHPQAPPPPRRACAQTERWAGGRGEGRPSLPWDRGARARGATAALLVCSPGCCGRTDGFTAMSGFSPELIDYLEGKISFEEFERRREERKTREKKVRRY